MLSLSQTTGYAVLALGCLEECGGRLVLARDIAACTGIPLPYLSKLLHTLRGRGLIHGKRGYRGGFSLSRPAARISLAEVAEAVEGPQWLPDCLLGLTDCTPEVLCPTYAFWKVERKKIERELRRTTLADVAAFLRKRGMIGGEGCCSRSESAAGNGTGKAAGAKGRAAVRERRR